MKPISLDFAEHLVLPADSALTLADYDRALLAVQRVDVYDACGFWLGSDGAGFLGLCASSCAANNSRALTLPHQL